MGQIQQIVLTGVDVGSTTQDITLTPVMPQNGNTPAQWSNLAVAQRDQRETLTALLTRSAGTNPADRYKITLIIPKTQTIDGKPTVIGQPYRTDVDIRLPDTGDSDLDQKILSMLSKVLADPSMVASITNRLAQY